MYIGENGPDLIREDVRQSKAKWDTNDGRTRVGQHELPEWDARDAGGQKRRSRSSRGCRRT